MDALIVPIAVFVGVTALVGSVAMLLRGRPDTKVESRLDVYTGLSHPAAKESLKQASLLTQPLDSRPGLLDRIAKRFGNIDLIFEQADTRLTLMRLVVVSGIMGGGALFIGIVARINLLVTPFLAAFAATLPLLWVLWRRKRRLRAFGAQLPDALDMLGRALRSGQSLGAGFNMVAAEIGQPLGKEFGRVFEEQNLGVALEESLDSLAERIPNLDLKFFATAVILQRQTGGDLAEILDKISSLIRERFQIWGQIQSLTGEGRLSGIVLMALPVLLFLALYKLNPDYVMVLFVDPMGKKMLAFAVFMQVIGALMIRKIVNIKV
jgi:tight adherence protein B